MRRIISFLMIVCLLHTQTCYAVAGLGEISSRVDFPRGSHVDLESGEGANPRTEAPSYLDQFSKLSTKLKETALDAKRSVSETWAIAKGCISEFLDAHPMVLLCVITSGILAAMISVVLGAIAFAAYVDGVPFSVLFRTMFLRGSAYDPMDVCPNLEGSARYLQTTRVYSQYSHSVSKTGLNFTDALAVWLNNANNIIEMLGAAVLAERCVGCSYSGVTYEFQKGLQKLLFGSGADMRGNYSCGFRFTPNENALGEIISCDTDAQKEALYYRNVEVPDAVDALVQFRRSSYKFGFQHPSDISVKVRAGKKTQRTYPELDYSPDFTHIDDGLRLSMQRRLLQADNSLSLAGAVKSRVENSLQIMAKLRDILYKLRFSETVSADEILVLSNVVRAVFDANQFVLTSDVACDASFEGNRFELDSCFEGAIQDVAGAPLSSDGQVWFVRNAGNTLEGIQAIANKAAVTEAMPVWLMRSTHVMENLWSIANSLHNRVCNATLMTQIEALRKAAQAELGGHELALNGALGCDVRFNDVGATDMVCHSGVAPELAEPGCDLNSSIPVRWDGKLWLQPHRLNPMWVDSVIVSANPVWVNSRSLTPEHSFTGLETNELTATNTQPSHTGDATGEVSDTASSSASELETQEKTVSENSGTGRGTASDALTEDATMSPSMSPEATASPSVTNSTGRATASDALTEDATMSPSMSPEASADATASPSVTNSTGRGTASDALTEDATMSPSMSPEATALRTYTPTQAQAAGPVEALTELYFSQGLVQNRRVLINSTFINITVLPDYVFGGARPLYFPQNNTLYVGEIASRTFSRYDFVNFQYSNQQTICSIPSSVVGGASSLEAYYISQNTNDLFSAFSASGSNAGIYWTQYNHQARSCVGSTYRITAQYTGPHTDQLYFNAATSKLMSFSNYMGQYGVMVWNFDRLAPTAELSSPFYVYNLSISSVLSFKYKESSKELYVYQKIGRFYYIQKAFFDFNNPAYINGLEELSKSSTNYYGLIGIAD